MESLLNAQTQLLKHKLEEIRKLEERIRDLMDNKYDLEFIFNGSPTKREFKGAIKMPKIVLAYTYPKLKAGDKVQVLTNSDHAIQGTRSQTSAWGSGAEAAFCNKTYTVTEDIVRKLKAQINIYMSEFPEPQDKPSWVMHYADFKMATTTEIVEVPVYQILKVNEENISNILLTHDKVQADEFLKTILETETDPKIKYTQIEFTIKKKIEKEYD